MKKIFLSLFIALVVGIGTVYANQITFVNLLSNVTFTFTITGSNPGSGPGAWHAEGVVIPPGNTTFSDPTTVPNVTSSALATGTFLSIYGFCSPYDIAVADPSLGGPPTYPPNVQNFNTSNACNNYQSFSINWQLNTTTGDVVVLIF